ncbi:MAG: hypothetical protein RLZZ157_144 [Pseudomonadota bacterium]|jgi:hypothetical protein
MRRVEVEVVPVQLPKAMAFGLGARSAHLQMHQPLLQTESAERREPNMSPLGGRGLLRKVHCVRTWCMRTCTQRPLTTPPTLKRRLACGAEAWVLDGAAFEEPDLGGVED